ncbi:unnamed protein product, partial [marine sediment metagenome]
PNSTFHWDKVDEVSPDSSTYIFNIGGHPFTDYDLYRLPLHSGSGTINHVKVYVYCKLQSQLGFIDIIIKTGGTEYDSPEYIDISTSWEYYSYQWNTNPKTRGAWTWDQIDALQIGLVLLNQYVGYEAYCSQVYVEIDYTPTDEKDEKPEFSPGELKTAIAPITVKPSGLSCSAELYLVSNDAKVATSGEKSFNSTGIEQDISHTLGN